MDGTDGRNTEREPTSPRPKRRRWLVLLAITLVLCGWFCHFAYLRITLRPTPRNEYWMAQLSALDPPRIGAISADQAGKILAACPQLVITDAQAGSGAPAAQDTPRGSRGQFPSSRTPTDPTDLLLGAWDETRPDIRAAGHLFMSEGFRKNREELRRALDAGWRCPAASGAVGGHGSDR